MRENMAGEEFESVGMYAQDLRRWKFLQGTSTVRLAFGPGDDDYIDVTMVSWGDDHKVEVRSPKVLDIEVDTGEGLTLRLPREGEQGG